MKDTAIENTAEYLKTQLRSKGFKGLRITYRSGHAFIKVGHGTISVHGNWDVWFTGRLPDAARKVVANANANRKAVSK